MKSIMKKPTLDYLYKKGGNKFTLLDQISIDLKCPKKLIKDAIKENPNLFETIEGFGDDKFVSVRLTRVAEKMFEKNQL